MMSLVDFLNERGITVYHDFDIKSEFWSKTGSTVSLFILPSNSSQLQKLMEKLHKENLDYKVLGSGSNTLFLDSVQYSIFISTKLLKKISFSDKAVTVEAGKHTEDFVREMSMRGFHGFEGLEGIPGTLGGAIFMNAGAFGYAISDQLVSINMIEPSGKTSTIGKDEVKFSTRSSGISRGSLKGTVISATFLTSPGDKDSIGDRISLFHSLRNTSLEYSFPNLGSVFALTNSEIYTDIKLNGIAHLRYRFLLYLYNSRLSPILTAAKNPTRRRINSLVFKHYKGISRNLTSPKTLNTFVNKDFSSLEILEHIKSLQEITKRRMQLENEPVMGPISKVLNENEYYAARKIVESL